MISIHVPLVHTTLVADHRSFALVSPVTSTNTAIVVVLVTTLRGCYEGCTTNQVASLHGPYIFNQAENNSEVVTWSESREAWG
jgi:hypothetical protein